MQRLGGQLRVISGPRGDMVLGLDMNAALGLAAALGVPPLAVAELLPPVEVALTRKLNDQIGGHDGEEAGWSSA